MPPPSISQHSWQVQRREGSKNREAARRAPTRTELQMGGGWRTEHPEKVLAG